MPSKTNTTQPIIRAFPAPNSALLAPRGIRNWPPLHAVRSTQHITHVQFPPSFHPGFPTHSIPRVFLPRSKLPQTGSFPRRSNFAPLHITPVPHAHNNPLHPDLLPPSNSSSAPPSQPSRSLVESLRQTFSFYDEPCCTGTFTHEWILSLIGI